jgi:hypothetical protein
MRTSESARPRTNVILHWQAELKVHPQRAVRRLMVHLSPFRLYRVRDAPEETLRRHRGDIRIRLATKLPVLGRKSGDGEHRT